MAWAGGRAHKPLQRERRRDIHAGAHGPPSGGRSNRRAHEWSVLWCPEPSPAERVDLWPPQRTLSHRARYKLRRLRDPTDDPRSDAQDGGSRRGQRSGTRSRDRSAVGGTGGLAEREVGAPCRRRPLNAVRSATANDKLSHWGPAASPSEANEFASLRSPRIRESFSSRCVVVGGP